MRGIISTHRERIGMTDNTEQAQAPDPRRRMRVPDILSKSSLPNDSAHQCMHIVTDTVASNYDELDTESFAESLSLGQIAAWYGHLTDAMDTIASVQDKLKKCRGLIESLAIEKMKANDIDSAKAPGISLRLGEKKFVRYDPERFDEAVQQLADAGLAHVLTRTFSAKKLEAAMIDGIRIPDSLEIDSKDTISYRRSKK